MTFPEASGNFVRLEKPPFLRGLRWKMTVAFVLFFFGLFTVLGMAGSAIEYISLRNFFSQAAANENEYAVNSGPIQVQNVFTIEYQRLKSDSSEILPWLESQPKNTDAIKIWLKRYEEKFKLWRKSDFPTVYTFPNDVDLRASLKSIDNLKMSPVRVEFCNDEKTKISNRSN